MRSSAVRANIRLSIGAVMVSAIIAAMVSNAGAAFAEGGVAPVLERPAAATEFGASAVLLGIARAGDRLVAVGERGIIMLSDDGGRTWRQAAVPVSVTLTAVAFGTPMNGWALGHSGVILHTVDGGQTWSRQLEGNQVAQLALSAAQNALRGGPATRSKQNDLRQARQLVTDGPDKPFLSLHAFDERRAMVVGAYGLMFATQDGGRTWQPWIDRVDNPERRHLYAIAVHGDDVYLAGEQGLFERSTDGGKHFARLTTPYRGTYFTLAVTPSNEILLAGLRGNAFRSRDGGASFTRVGSPVAASLSGATEVRGGRVVLTTEAGGVMQWRAGEHALQPLAAPALPPLAAAAQASDGALVVVGVAGALRLPLATISYARSSR